MSSKVIVFDFDKTLTIKDTVFGFYRAVSGNDVAYTPKRYLFFVAAVMYKFKLLSNSRLKKLGAKLFLKGRSQEGLKAIGIEYASEIEMNRVYRDEFKKYDSEQVIILSASFEEYLEPLFPKHKIAGSQVKYDEKGVACGIKRNLFGIEKRKWLAMQGIENISVLYTDSFSDKPLMDISKSVYLVEGNSCKLIKEKNSNEL